MVAHVNLMQHKDHT